MIQTQTPFVHFPERAAVIDELMARARRELDPRLILMPVETGGGKTRLATYLTTEAGLPTHAALSIRAGSYGPDSILHDLLDALHVERPRDKNYGDLGVPVLVQLPIEQAMDTFDAALVEANAGLLLIDDAQGIMSQQSPSARRWLQALIRRLMRDHRMSVVLMFCPDEEWPAVPGEKPAHLFLGTLGPSPECGAWLDVLQDDAVRACASARVAPLQLEGRLSEPDIMLTLIKRNHGMLGFIEADAVEAVMIGPREGRGPHAVRQRVDCYSRRDDCPAQFRLRVFASLWKAYERAV
jgi:hypothetical protein